jgi:hypothetical protein
MRGKTAHPQLLTPLRKTIISGAAQAIKAAIATQNRRSKIRFVIFRAAHLELLARGAWILCYDS